MSIDVLAHRASQSLRSASGALDVDEALRQTLERTRRRQRIGLSLVIVTAVIVLIVGWSLSGELRRPAVPAPPVDAPSPALVGSRLGAPMSAVTPSGWDIVHDGAYVDLRASDGSNARIVMVVPRTVFDPPAYKPAPLKGDPALWTTTHPSLKSNGRFGVDGPEFAWAGSKADLSLPAKAGEDSIPLVALTKGAGAPALSISDEDKTFRWTVVYFEDSDPLAIAATSPAPDDPNLTRSINDLLASIQIQSQ